MLAQAMHNAIAIDNAIAIAFAIARPTNLGTTSHQAFIKTSKAITFLALTMN